MRIGFNLLRGGGGPTVFMSRLRHEMKQMEGIKTTTFLDPTANILLFANKVRNPWGRPYIFRVDGIVFDSALPENEIDQRNSDVLNGLSKAAGIVFQSKFDEALVRAHLDLPAVPSTVIPNGVDLNTFTPDGPSMRNALGIAPDTLVFATSAKWRKHKRLEAVIDVFQRYRLNMESNSVLLVLGTLDNKPEGALDGVHFIGHVSPEELPGWYRTADVFLFFSWLDHCPNTVVEAIASGLPVLCTNQGGTKELIELTQGGIVSDADSEYDFKRVRLYEPPQPNLDVLFYSIREIVAKRHEIKSRADRERVGISRIAREYESFLRSVSPK